MKCRTTLRLAGVWWPVVLIAWLVPQPMLAQKPLPKDKGCPEDIRHYVEGIRGSVQRLSLAKDMAKEAKQLVTEGIAKGQTCGKAPAAWVGLLELGVHSMTSQEVVSRFPIAIGDKTVASLLEWAQEAHRRFPKNADVTMHWAELENFQRNNEAALTEASKQVSNQPQLRWEWGKTLLRMHRAAYALSVWKQGEVSGNNIPENPCVAWSASMKNFQEAPLWLAAAYLALSNVGSAKEVLHCSKPLAALYGSEEWRKEQDKQALLGLSSLMMLRLEEGLPILQKVPLEAVKKWSRLLGTALRLRINTLLEKPRTPPLLPVGKKFLETLLENASGQNLLGKA